MSEIEQIKLEIREIIKGKVDLDTLVDLSASIITNYGIKLTDRDIIELCDEYFVINGEKTNRTILNNADILYQNLHRANNTV